MILTLTCNRCGRPFDVDRADLLAGPQHYRRCPRCREAPTSPARRQSSFRDGIGREVQLAARTRRDDAAPAGAGVRDG